MSLDRNYLNFLPHNEARSFILDPVATGIDDKGNIRPLDFIADIFLSCSLTDEPYISSINIGRELVSVIIATAETPILSATVLKSDWIYGRPVFLEQITEGYSGWLTPGRLNILDLPVIHRYSSAAQSKIAERCLFRSEHLFLAATCDKTHIRFNGLVELIGDNGLTITAKDNKIFFVLEDELKKDLANGINYFTQYQETPMHNVGHINGAAAGADGSLAVRFIGPFTVAPIIERLPEQPDKTVGAHLGIDFDLQALCPDPDYHITTIPTPEADCVTTAPYFPECEELILPELTCPEGFRLVGDVCVRVSGGNNDPPGSCPEGFTLINGICTPDRFEPPPVLTCPEGFTLINGVCVRDEEVIQCPPGHILVGGVCVDNSTPGPPINCLAGFHSSGGLCVRDTNSRLTLRNSAWDWYYIPFGTFCSRGTCGSWAYSRNIEVRRTWFEPDVIWNFRFYNHTPGHPDSNYDQLNHSLPGNRVLGLFMKPLPHPMDFNGEYILKMRLHRQSTGEVLVDTTNLPWPQLDNPWFMPWRRVANGQPSTSGRPRFWAGFGVLQAY